MLMTAVRWLEKAGASVSEVVREPQAPGMDTRPDAVLAVEIDGLRTELAVEERRRAPYPNELVRLAPLRDSLHRLGQPLLIAPYVAPPLAGALERAGWSWADAEGNFGIRGPGLLWRQRRTTEPPKPRHAGLPQGSGGLAIIRELIDFMVGEGEELSATTLAGHARVTQPRASQVLGRLESLGLVQKTSRGRWSPAREALLDALLSQYSGPGGWEDYYYSLDPPMDVALAAVQGVDGEHTFAISADVGPDLLTPYRRPDVLVVYARDDVPFHASGLVEAQGVHDANVVVRYPADQSVFPWKPFVARHNGIDLPLAHPTQMILDLEELGGADRLEQAGMIRAWVLNRP